MEMFWDRLYMDVLCACWDILVKSLPQVSHCFGFEDIFDTKNKIV